MPPRPLPPDAKPPRRRPGPSLPGGWILVLFLMVLGVFIFTQISGTGNLEYGDFVRLVFDSKSNWNLKKVTFVGTERIQGEVRDRSALPEDVQKYVSSSGQFNTIKPPLDDKALSEQLNKLASESRKNPEGKEVESLKIERQEDKWSWLGTAIMVILPIAFLLILFFVLIPRFRDPLGGSFLSNYIKSPARRYDRSKMRVTFEDVADMMNARL